MLIVRLPLISILLLLFAATAGAQALRYPVALPYIGPGAYSVQHTDVFSFTANQAALAQQKNAAAGVYGERRFMLAATSAYRAVAAVPTRLGNFGLQVNYAGFKNFSENAVGLAYARSLGTRVDVGIQFNYYGWRVPAYSNASAINVEAGAILHFSDRLHGGIHVYNPVAAPISKATGEKLAAAFKLGLGYDASDKFFAGAEVTKEEDRPVSVTGSVKYCFAQQFFARAGFVSGSSTGFAGAGLAWNNLRIDVAGSWHPQLGLSPGLMIAFDINRKKD